MLSLADVVHATRSYAVGLGCVATVGKVHVQPGGVNAIASHVTAWLDARGRSAERRCRAAVEAVTADAERLGGTVREESWTPTTDFDAAARQPAAAASCPTRRCWARAPGTTRASLPRMGFRQR